MVSDLQPMSTEMNVFFFKKIETVFYTALGFSFVYYLLSLHEQAQYNI